MSSAPRQTAASIAAPWYCTSSTSGGVPLPMWADPLVNYSTSIGIDLPRCPVFNYSPNQSILLNVRRRTIKYTDFGKALK